MAEGKINSAYNGVFCTIPSIQIVGTGKQYYMLHYREYVPSCTCNFIKPQPVRICYNNVYSLFKKSIYSTFNEVDQERVGKYIHCIDCKKQYTPDTEKDRFVRCVKFNCTMFGHIPVTAWILGDSLKCIGTLSEYENLCVCIRGILIARPSTIVHGTITYEYMLIIMGMSNVISLPK